MKCMRKTKTILVLTMAAAILLVSVGTTLAYLTTKTAPITNTFLPTEVTCEVHDSMEGNVKSNITVKNTGSTDAFIRVALVGNWYDAKGNVVAPWNGRYPDPANNWSLINGYYYYANAVASGASTPSLFGEAKISAGNAPVEGAHLEMTVIAQAIQATSDAVEHAWGVTFTAAN